jgi:solute carrier family 25 phosphate transporter 23/24/25/41
VAYKLTAGALAGATSGAILYPNDTVRRLMQMQGHHGRPMLYKNTIACWKHTYQHGGVRRFYQGVWPYMARLVPNSAITFGCFEFAKQILDL